MAEIYAMAPGHPHWNKTLSLAAACSWRAGPYFAEKMKHHAFAGWERVFSQRSFAHFHWGSCRAAKPFFQGGCRLPGAGASPFCAQGEQGHHRLFT